jgi:uncharacterized DUF497 family protein
MRRAKFEWDSDKDAENQTKHGVSFSAAQFAFADPKRIIAEDVAHSKTEKRYFVLAVSTEALWLFVLLIVLAQFESLALVIGGKEMQFMKAKIKYSDEPVKAKVIRDFLPPPEELAFCEEGVKVTIALSKKSVSFFKAEAKKHHTQYQRMIRKLIDAYVDVYTPPH